MERCLKVNIGRSVLGTVVFRIVVEVQQKQNGHEGCLGFWFVCVINEFMYICLYYVLNIHNIILRYCTLAYPLLYLGFILGDTHVNTPTLVNKLRKMIWNVK